MSTRDGAEATADFPAFEIVKRVLGAGDAAPIEDMESLVTAARADAEFRRQLLQGTAEVLAADPPGLVPCWLVLATGELGPPAFPPLLAALGTSAGDAVDEAILAVLTRNAVAAYDDITFAVEGSATEDADYRADLYGVLIAVALGADDLYRDRLRAFVLRRVDAWRIAVVPREAEAEAEALAALVHMVAPEVMQFSDAGGLADPQSALGRQILTVTRILGEDWRATARDIEWRYGSRSETAVHREAQ